MGVFVVRQPIFNIAQNVHAYELVFRDGIAKNCNFSDSKVINGEFSLEELTNGKKAFIDFDLDSILKEAPLKFSEKLISVEISANNRDTEVLLACMNLREHGYQLVLDGFNLSSLDSSLSDYVDLIKINFAETTREERVTLMGNICNDDVEFMAYNIDTIEDYQEAKSLGFSYFQGYFFIRSSGEKNERELSGNKLNCLRILQAVNKVNVDFNELEEYIMMDVVLTYKLLRFVNSAFFGFVTRIHSIKHALVILGLNEIKKWVSLISLNDMAVDKSKEIIDMALLRAKLCEGLASVTGSKDREFDLFLMGLFSVIDALLDKSMFAILTKIPLPLEIKDALLGKENPYKDILDLVRYYEKSQWNDFAEAIQKQGIDEDVFAELYLESVKWSNQIFLVQ